MHTFAPSFESNMKHQQSINNLLLATAEQSRETDRLTIESLSITADTLMEIAGNRAAEIICADFPPGCSVLLVCGKGNNAGDALVIARILLDRGYRIALLPVFGTDGFSGEAARNFDRLMKIADMVPSGETAGIADTGVEILSQWQDNHVFEPFNLIIDGIFGTGLERDVKAPVSDVIGHINHAARAPVYALDIPSGLHCDTGDILGTAINADKTIQFGLRKLGCYLGDGPEYAGIREFVALPFPGYFKRNIQVRLIDETRDPARLLKGFDPKYDTTAAPASPCDKTAPGTAASVINTTGDAATFKRAGDKRDGDKKISLHKYNNGVVHVIGGSPGLTGAPLHSARAAWSLGMGAVTLIYPSAWLSVVEAQAPELIKKPIGDAGTQIFTENNVETVLALLQAKLGVTVIGPGIGRDEQTLAFVRKVVEKSKGPLIIDADGLHAIPKHEHIIMRRKQPSRVILTPHPGELASLVQSKFPRDANRMDETVTLAGRLGCTVLAKGNPVFTHCPSVPITLLTGYDTSIFARAGFGDILSGHIAAFFARTDNPLASCENGLLYGYQKVNDVTSRGIRFPEPSDLT